MLPTNCKAYAVTPRSAHTEFGKGAPQRRRPSATNHGSQLKGSEVTPDKDKSPRDEVLPLYSHQTRCTVDTVKHNNVMHLQATLPSSRGHSSLCPQQEAPKSSFRCVRLSAGLGIVGTGNHFGAHDKVSLPIDQERLKSSNCKKSTYYQFTPEKVTKSFMICRV